MLSIENLTKKFGDFLVLDDISLNFKSGVYGLLAPNGAGKTTLMKLIVTLLFPTKGQIFWNGEDILTMDERYRSLIGYLPQKFGYYPNSTPREFLHYVSILQKVPKDEAKVRIENLLEQVGLKEVGDKKLKKFSGGMLQRLGIAVSLINNPEILILDEPTAGLDPKERVKFRNLIHLLASNRIVILSTHIVSDVETIAKEIVMIRNGKIYCKDTPANIRNQFIGKIYQLPGDSLLSENQFLLSEVRGESGTEIRVLSDTKPKNSISMEPTLEDAFLAIYR